VFLRRVTITGFKSFANKTVLDLEPGITAVVGPNGSGKSNLADAIRWAFGEQSKGRLRLGDREDVVFAGTDKRSRASYAEVVLLFDNEDGAFPLDLTEVEIARRLYRSGETDYRLAGRIVRLADIQALLAQSGFGANTYSVIGQGMIDSFLLSSPAERKLLFDEAAGIRGPELGREAALRKLDATSRNLTRLRDILAELTPRLQSLEHAVTAAQVQRELEAKVADLRAAVAAAKVAHWAGLHDTATHRLAEVAAELERLHCDSDRLERDLAAAQAKQAGASREREQLQESLAELEQARDHLGLELAERRGAVAESERAAAQTLDLAAQLEGAQAELATARARCAELETELASNSEARDRAMKTVDAASREVAAAQSELVAIRKRNLGDGTRDQYVDHALQILRTLATSLSAKDLKVDEVRLLVHKAGRLLSHATRTGAAELLAELKSAQKQLETAMNRRETAIEHQTNIIITARSLEIDLQHQQEAVERTATAVAVLEEQLAPLQVHAKQLAHLEAEAEHTAKALRSATLELERQRDLIRELGADSDTSGDQATTATALERARAASTAAEAERTALNHRLAEAATALAAARQQAPESTTKAPIQPLDQLESQLLRAEAQLEAHSAVQRDQVAEYESVKTRHSELTTQIADLEVAGADLEGVISELDSVIRDRFRTNFAQLAEQFSTYFTRLFDGGSASLELTETDDGSYGIAIKASPKGKRLSALAALSGGERALAGVALLAAILRVNPSPFVVMDEIDAALDEANSGRLASILEELQEHSQLIVITHNRQTMHAARVLFGVTMNEHHVSHLLSMRLEQATELAAR
jgi:chromosome segregation protein